MRKNLIHFVYVIAAFVAITACSGKKDGHDSEDHHHDEAATDEKWAAMDEFHTLMAESFHPYKDTANLAPAKANAAALAESAAKWQSAPLPGKVDNDEVKVKLEKLKASTAAFAETVKTADDKVIADSLTQLHDLFHEIQESWYGGKHHHDHH